MVFSKLNGGAHTLKVNVTDANGNSAPRAKRLP